MSQPRQTASPEGWRPAGPARSPVLFVNPRSGGGAAARAGVAERARELGIEVIILDPGQSLTALAGAAAASGAGALGMAGGDGSLAEVAAVAAAHGLPFVCVPAGTRNHFALDLGVDRRDLTGALEAFTDGVERLIDVGDVNGRMFLNNVSLGVYGEAVRRPEYRDAKVRTLLQTAEQVAGPSGQATGLRLTDDAGREHRGVELVLVSNNPYALERPLPRGTRPALDSGQLGIVIIAPPGSGPPAWPVLARAEPGRQRPGTGARRDRRRARRPDPAAAFHDPAGSAAGTDLAAPSGHAAGRARPPAHPAAAALGRPVRPSAGYPAPAGQRRQDTFRVPDFEGDDDVRDAAEQGEEPDPEDQQQRPGRKCLLRGPESDDDLRRFPRALRATSSG